MSASPTLRQIEVLRLLAEVPQPTIRDIGERLSIASTNGVNDHFKALERKGLIEREHQAARSIALTAKGRQYIGQVCCPTCGQWAQRRVTEAA
jgi:repressor LexA